MKKYRMSVLKDGKLLCFSDKYLLYVKGIKVQCVNIKTEESVYITSVVGISMWMSVLSLIPIFKRLLRLEPRCGIFFDDDNAIISFRGSIYRVAIEEKRIYVEHSFTEKMNNPLSFSEIKGIDGFADGIVYGEYTNDNSEKEVAIYQRNQHGNWSRLYAFPKGLVKHIHTILPSKERKSVFVFTGDSDSESGIWEFTNNFTSVRKSLTGKQLFRACVASIDENELVYVTDMPDYENYIFSLNWDEGESSLKKIMDVAGPCIYGAKLKNNDLVFSTSVEGNSELKGILSWVSCSIGRGVKDRYSHVYIGNSKKGFKEIYSASKDLLPLRLFGFGTISFPQGKMDKIIAVGNCLKRISGKTIILDRRKDNER